MRPRGVFRLGEFLLAQWAPGFVFAMGWTALYEIYHEEGSYFTTLLQEILGTEDMFPYFLLLAILLSVPVGMMVDALRHVVGELWLGLPRSRGRPRAAVGGRGAWMAYPPSPGADFAARYLIYRDACATLLTPAKAAGNLALVSLVLGVWLTIKIFQMGGFRVFSAPFVIGTPLLILALVAGLVVRYAAGLEAFRRQAQSWEAAAAPVPVPGGGPERPAPFAPSSSLAESLPPPLDRVEGRP